MDFKDVLRRKDKAERGIVKAILFHREHHVPLTMPEQRRFDTCQAYPCRLTHEGSEFEKTALRNG